MEDLAAQVWQKIIEGLNFDDGKNSSEHGSGK